MAASPPFSLSAGHMMVLFDPEGSRGSDASPSHLSPGASATTPAPAEEIWVLRKPYAGMGGKGGAVSWDEGRGWEDAEAHILETAFQLLVSHRMGTL